MSEDKMKNFLKENAAPVPDAPLGESSRIWRHVSERRPRVKWWLSLAPLAGVSLVFIIFLQMQKTATEVKLEEEYLHQEWADLVSDVNSDFEPELITAFDK